MFQSDAKVSSAIRELFHHPEIPESSDIHLYRDHVPVVRKHGDLTELSLPVMTASDIEGLLVAAGSPSVLERIRAEKNLDFAFTVNVNGSNMRFRANFFFANGTLGACLRLIPEAIPSLDWAEFPVELAEKLAAPLDGLIILTGATGSGKSTSLAMIVNLLSKQGGSRIITVEEPIEYQFPRSRHSVITQREVGVDVLSFADGLKYGLRQDPDVILVGEVRDRETAQMALSAAETGHLVFTTLHTRDAKGAISRFADLFPLDMQKDVRTQLAMSLRAIVAQRLLPDPVKGAKRHLALEVLWNINPVAAGIRQGKLESIDNYLITARDEGLLSFDESVRQLLRRKMITRDVALRNVREPMMLDR